MDNQHPIGIFDSGYGGLTVFRSIADKLPQYDYIYLGDNARAPYGGRSFDTVHQYTLQSVKWLFKMGCPLVILACNTASAKALRTIQRNDLPAIAPDNRVLGVIRPTAEVVDDYTKTKSVGVLGTKGTITSGSYGIEIKKFAPEIKVYQQACPMWVPLIENNDYMSDEADFFVRKNLNELMTQSDDIDTVLLACTHYPILIDKIRKVLPAHINIVSQGPIIAESLADYLHRHPEMEARLTQNGSKQFYTTDDAGDFNEHATLFFGEEVNAAHLNLQ
jgi:glutamate racemase